MIIYVLNIYIYIFCFEIFFLISFYKFINLYNINFNLTNKYINMFGLVKNQISDNYRL